MRALPPLPACLLVLAASVTFNGPAIEAAAEKLPQVPQLIRLGFPSSTDRSDLENSALFRSAVDTLTEISVGPRSGRAAATVEVDLALGSDYQILQWLEDGSLDAGLVSPFMLHLFLTQPVGGRRATTFVALADPLAPGRPMVLPAAGSRPSFRSLELRQGLWADRASPLEDLHVFLQALLERSLQTEEIAGDPGLPYCLAFPSHLSTSGFISPLLYTRRWLDDAAGPPARESADPAGLTMEGRRNFWAAFFRHSRFSLLLDADGLPSREGCTGRGGVSSGRTGTIEIVFSHDGWIGGEGEASPGWQPLPLVDVTGSGPSGFVLLVDRQAARSLFRDVVEVTEIWPGFGGVLRELHADPALKRLTAPQFRKARLYPGRAYGYTIDEVMSLLRRDQMDSGVGSLALVLPGGGVKAAYQSLLLDHLYGRHLRNRPRVRDTAGPESDPLLDVRYVIGNSGGALLGFFVSQLHEDDPRSLHEMLLTNDRGVTLTSVDIFGYLDIMRWITVLAHYTLFAFIFIVATLPIKSPLRRPPPRTFAGMRIALMGPLYLLALAAPYWIRPTTSVEHVPWAWGIFYFLFLCLVFYAESAFKAERREVAAAPGWQAAAWYALALIAAITARIASSYGRPWINSALLGAALVSSAVAIILGARSRPHRYKPLSTGVAFLSGMGLPLLTLVASYALFAILVARGETSPLELTSSFWVRFATLSFILSALVITLGYFKIGRERGLAFIHRGLDFLAERHPSGRLVSLRLLRVLFFFLAGLAWWNLIVAPGLYGNEYARTYLEGVMERFEKAAPDHQGAGRGVPGTPEAGTGLRTFYVAPANSLEKNAERYFISPPDTLSRWELPVEISGDDRWTVIRDKDLLKKIIFASGSPFPIFPPHVIKVPRPSPASRAAAGGAKYRIEALVDGGYAHNVPVEAAKQVGSRQALIIHSENPSTEAGDGLLGSLEPGPLTTNLPRLMPFMFERSQTLDNLSKRSLFVASLAPSWSKPGWPKLFDFRRSVVEWMHAEAEGDLDRRIGTVESWGRPRFVFRIRDGYYIQHGLIAQSSSLD